MATCGHWQTCPHRARISCGRRLGECPACTACTATASCSDFGSFSCAEHVLVNLKRPSICTGECEMMRCSMSYRQRTRENGADAAMCSCGRPCASLFARGSIPSSGCGGMGCMLRSCGTATAMDHGNDGCPCTQRMRENWTNAAMCSCSRSCASLFARGSIPNGGCGGFDRVLRSCGAATAMDHGNDA